MSASMPVGLVLLQSRFETCVLPRALRHARIYFRDVRCPVQREECIAEVAAICWQWFVRLARKGKDATKFASVLAAYAARGVRCGRRLTGQEKARDVLSPTAQLRHGFVVEPLPSSTATSHEFLYADPHGQQKHDEYEERLQDNTQTPVPDQVQFRIDFPAWLKTLTARERRIIRCMIRNERTKDLGQMFDLSPGRISQLRSEFRDDWQRFCEDDTD